MRRTEIPVSARMTHCELLRRCDTTTSQTRAAHEVVAMTRRTTYPRPFAVQLTPDCVCHTRGEVAEAEAGTVGMPAREGMRFLRVKMVTRGRRGEVMGRRKKDGRWVAVDTGLVEEEGGEGRCGRRWLLLSETALAYVGSERRKDIPHRTRRDDSTKTHAHLPTY
ncbi:hypothetical protein OH77DRAFT_1151986 [Trametes cingulata]|nr:hypothetical protein OH77DRAFT_1151986 [Trametes cingulata]